LAEYVHEVREGKFPTESQSTHIDQKVIETATPVFVEHLISVVEDMDGEVEIISDDESSLKSDFDRGNEGTDKFFGGGSRAHLN